MDPVGQTVAALLAGEPVVLPTDTVYGLCADAGSEPACRRAFALKCRSERQPSALLFSSIEAALDRVPDLPEHVLRGLLPAPLTLVFPNTSGRYPWLGEDTIGIRVPRLPPAAAEVMRQVAVVMATSANLHGGPNSRTLADVPEEIRAACGAVVDGGELPGVPSTVISFAGEEPVVLRAGAVSAAEALSRVAKT